MKRSVRDGLISILELDVFASVWVISEKERKRKWSEERGKSAIPSQIQSCCLIWKPSSSLSLHSLTFSLLISFRSNCCFAPLTLGYTLLLIFLVSAVQALFSDGTLFYVLLLVMMLLLFDSEQNIDCFSSFSFFPTHFSQM